MGVERTPSVELCCMFFWLHEEVRFWGRWLNSQGVRGCGLMCKRCEKRVPALRVMRYRACRQWGSKRNPSPGSTFCGEGSSYGVFVSHRFGSVGSCICAFSSRVMVVADRDSQPGLVQGSAYA
jgi:hypothetical protein